MSQFNAPREESYEDASYPSSTDDNSSSLVDMHYRQVNQYSPGSYSAFPSLQEGQQHAYYDASYADPATDSRQWSRGTNTYQDENHAWNMHRTAYPMAGMAEGFFEGTDQAVHGDVSGYQFQDAEASGGHYGSELAMGTEVSGYQQPDMTGRSGHPRDRMGSLPIQAARHW
ncbi:hypothetical protein DBV05_g10235 [Lasiodiplodia theobromae]|uniref:Uncharacterized protein n=1 Tax=Lasiodiplodia theobromae TaxID=45133 RepID=A0A5N5D0H2_9PEZI|nr:hypothetical protein DBV05_g10235 [Lasiodiplodia theobromae]